MRWSLILSAFITVLSVQSLLSFALVTTQNEGALEKRVLGLGKGKKKDIKASSSTYRSNSMSHPYAYDFGPNGVTRQSLPKDQRQGFFSKMFKGKKYDADHIYEAQMYHDTLRRQGTSHAQLPPNLQEDARRIMNGPDNMAPIRPDVNRSKGQMVRQGIKNKSLRKSNGLARSYSLSSYPSARQTAEQLQHTFQQHGYGQQGPTFHDTLHNTMTHAGVLTPGQPSPPNSPPHHSQSVSYHHSGSQPVIPQMHRSQSTRPSSSSRRQRTPSVSGSQPVIPQMHRSQSTRPSSSSRRQRAPSVSHQQPMYQHPHTSSSYVPQQQVPMYQHSHASSSYVPHQQVVHQPVYQNQYAHASTPYFSHPSTHASSSNPYHPPSPYHPY